MTDVQSAVDDKAEEIGFTGAVRVDVGGDIVIDTGYGLADRANAIPNTAATRFAMASGSKGFTALTVVRLVEEGALALDTTARSLLGADLPLVDGAVTVEHLLGHRSGIGDYLDEDDDEIEITDYVLARPVHELATTEAVPPAPRRVPAEVRAGQRLLVLQRRLRGAGPAGGAGWRRALPRPGPPPRARARRAGRHGVPPHRRASNTLNEVEDIKKKKKKKKKKPVSCCCRRPA